MPVMDGLEACEKIMARDAEERVIFVNVAVTVKVVVCDSSFTRFQLQVRQCLPPTIRRIESNVGREWRWFRRKC